MAEKLRKAFLERLKRVKGKRSRTVIDHILKYGYITTEDLRDTYGYDHPPRAVRDVKEQGIPIERYTVAGKHGRRIAAYRFGDPGGVRSAPYRGRRVFSRKFKVRLFELNGTRCGICAGDYEARHLQIDHRVPYEVAGDVKDEPASEDFMLICGSCNRAKSWSCEHCRNWKTDHDPKVCNSCYWASPEKYAHIALRVIRRLDVVWTEEEVSVYDKLLQLSKEVRTKLPRFVKDILEKHAQEGC